MEDALRADYSPALTVADGLNPCFNGRYSQSI